MTLVDADAAGLRASVEALRRGGLIAFPTDTVFGLACMATDPAALSRFNAVKRRDAKRPAVVMVADMGLAAEWAELDDVAHDLMGRFWPGALTLVLRASPAALQQMGRVCRDGTIAMRVPAHKVALQLLQDAGAPLATSSANRAGDPAPSSSAEVLANLGEDVDTIIRGRSPGGVASTIVDLTGKELRILREGSITREALIS